MDRINLGQALKEVTSNIAPRKELLSLALSKIDVTRVIPGRNISREVNSEGRFRNLYNNLIENMNKQTKIWGTATIALVLLIAGASAAIHKSKQAEVKAPTEQVPIVQTDFSKVSGNPDEIVNNIITSSDQEKTTLESAGDDDATEVLDESADDQSLKSQDKMNDETNNDQTNNDQTNLDEKSKVDDNQNNIKELDGTKYEDQF